MPRDNPVSFRLSDEGREALDWLAIRRGQNRSRVVETLLIDAREHEEATNLEARVGELEERLKKLEERR